MTPKWKEKKKVAEGKQKLSSQTEVSRPSWSCFCQKGRFLLHSSSTSSPQTANHPHCEAPLKLVHKWQFFLFCFFPFCFSERVGWSNKSRNSRAVIISLGLIKEAVLGSAVCFSRTDREEWAGMKRRRDETEQASPSTQEEECLSSGGFSAAPAAHAGSTCGSVRQAGPG